jgi:hypothetical protein
VRVLLELGPDKGALALERVKSARWELAYDPARAGQELLVGAERKSGLSTVVLDIEHCLGRVERHARWEPALALLPMPPVVEPVSP